MKPELSLPPLAPEAEIAALVATMQEAERRLEELTGGEVDTVASGSGPPILLRRAQEQWRNREAENKAAILNALPAHIALLDAQGVILSVNETWRQFAAANLLAAPAAGVGQNYLEICDRARGAHSAEAAAVAAGIRAVLTGAPTFSLEYPCHAPTERRWFLLTVAPLRHAGAPGAVVMHLDITDRREAEMAQRRAKKRLRDLIDGLGASMMVGLMTPDGILVEANAPALMAVGLDPGDALGRPLVDSPWFAYSAEVKQQLRDAIARGLRGEASRYDMTIHGTDGQLIEVDFALNPVRDEAGEVVYLVPSGNVITERKLAETALREGNEKFRQLADNITDAFWIRSPDMSEVQYVSPAFEKIWGRTVAALQAKPHEWVDFILAEDRARVQAAFAALTSAGPSLDIEYRIVRPDGEIRWIRARGFQVRNAADQLIRHIGIVSDITERRQATAELQWKTAFLEAQISSSIDGILVVDERGTKLSQNQRMIDLLQIPPALANDPDDAKQLRWVSTTTRFPEQFTEKIAFLNLHPNEISRDEVELKNGTTLDRYSAPVVGPDGKYYGRIWTFRDISERKRNMEAVRASEQRFKALFEQAAVGVIQSDAVTGRLVQANRRFCAMVGYSAEELQQLTFSKITHPQDLARTLEMVGRVKAGAIRDYALEKRYVRKDGSEVWAEVTVSAMWAAGEPPDYFIAVAQDITERRKIQEQLRQSQKMDAIGTLAGGIAHDFNNILAAIGGYTELARMTLTDNPGPRAHLGAVLQAVKRAAELVRQILTFSRQQPLERKPIELGPLVKETFGLLRATIPATVEFDLAVATDAPIVLADASQVHQILMNLGTNAWHAMKDRPGRLGVKLERLMVDEALAATQPQLHPGLYARVSVSDTGKGMDPTTLTRVFDPFFTTKAPGEGTGLGLAVVHGIMDNHDGAITVESKRGAGTVFHVYFPAHVGPVTTAAVELPSVPRGHGERILVVDDELMLAQMMQQSLVTLGYAAEFATDPVAALAMVRAEAQRFALVLTDLAMPGMTGMVLAAQLLHIRPGLPIILLTGYSATLTTAHAKAEGLQDLLLKPISLPSLGAAVHAALSAQTTS